MKKWTDADMLAFANKMVYRVTHKNVMGHVLSRVDSMDLDEYGQQEALRFDFTLKFSPSVKILEVRRTSDGEVFKLGDSIQYNGSEYRPWVIGGFKVRDGHVFINDHHSPDETLRLCNWVKPKPAQPDRFQSPAGLPSTQVWNWVRQLVRDEVENQLNGTKKTD